MTAYWTTHAGPLGALLLTCDATGALTSLTVPGAPGAKGVPAPGAVHDEAPFAQARHELDEYFAGDRDHFTLRLGTPPATPFRARVWAALDEIPYGTTVSYGQLAARIGATRPAVRAVGGAVGANPLLVVRPCHRVVGADGSLTGYAGGLERKTWLLGLEGARTAAPTG
ncbi:methylated-DNA--[protein]-cysteine S-methyltransferase [Streptomyces sp. NPDC058372]|uniref:methylated-DNA--[protein]-cysteine S-methyltransferase n=1 Tax=unclassified Streptomyces TaxID=2593676 RepID=UPI003651012A